MPAGVVKPSFGAAGAAGCAAAGGVWPAGGCCDVVGGGCCGGVVGGCCVVVGGVWAKAAAGASTSASAKVEVTKERIPISSLGEGKRNHTLSHENGHHFVGHQHAVPRQPEPARVPDEPSRVDKRP